MGSRNLFNIVQRCLAGLLCLLAVSASAQTAPKKVVLFIGDGVGVSYWTAAVYEREDVAIRRFKTLGLVDTRAATEPITDSAASATAYATGVRTYNGAISVDVDGNPLVTVVEEAKSRGMATGVVATSSVTHATPACFVAHVTSRTMQFDIARQMALLSPEVILGGGLKYFSPDTRPDSLDLLGPLAADHRIVLSPEELEAVDLTHTDRLVGLFAADGMPRAAQRMPSLPQMAKAAIAVLDRDPEGFFVMIEGSQPDWRGHDNEPLGEIVNEMMDFDEAIGVALDYQRAHPETLIVVVADHETGGLAIQAAPDSVALVSAEGMVDSAAGTMSQSVDLSQHVDASMSDSTGALSLVARYTTGHHTAQMVPLFASGPHAERFGGILRNDEIGALLMDFVRE